MYVYVVYRCEPFECNIECGTYDSIYKAKDWILHRGRRIGYFKSDLKAKYVKYNAKLRYKKSKGHDKMLDMLKDYYKNNIPLYFIERHEVK